MECKYHLEFKWVTKIITITSTFDDEGRVGSNTCSGFRVSFNQELHFYVFIMRFYVIVVYVQRKSDVLNQTFL